MTFYVEVRSQSIPFDRRIALFSVIDVDDAEQAKVESREWARSLACRAAFPQPWLRVWDDADTMLIDEPVANI